MLFRSDALEGIVRRDVIGKLEKTAQPIQTLVAERLDLLPILGTAHHGTQADDDDVEQQMSFVPINAWVFEFAKMVFDGKRGSQGNSSMNGDVISVPIVAAFT